MFAAVNGLVDPASASPARLTLLGELALEAYDAGNAEQYALRAVRESPKNRQANRLLARVYVVLGEPAKAIAAARDFMRANPRRGMFELAEIYQDLGRVEDAHQELERLRAANAPRGRDRPAPGGAGLRFRRPAGGAAAVRRSRREGRGRREHADVPVGHRRAGGRCRRGARRVRQARGFLACARGAREGGGTAA